MIAILGLVSTGLSILSSTLGIAKIIKQWHKPAGYLIRFINWIGGMVDWVIVKVEVAQGWIGTKQEVIEVKKETKRRHRARYGRWKGRR